MFGDVKNCNGDVPIINVDDIHCETIQNVNKEHIGAFCKTANRKFAIILKEVELKDLYSYEINFKGKVGYTEHIYRILPLPPPRGNERGRTNFPNAVFVTMFLLTTVSDTAVKKANLEFGEVHHVFSGKFKKPYSDISNGKRHIRITPYKTKDDLPHKVFFDDSRLFQVMWAEKKVSCKKCVHMLRDTCHPAPDNIANEGSPLIMRILHWFLQRVGANELPLRTQHQIRMQLLLQLWEPTFDSLFRIWFDNGRDN